MYVAKTPDEFLDLIDQAIFEIEDLLACAGDEGDSEYEFTDLLPLYEHLASELKKLHADMKRGAHEFGKGKDLSFMPLVKQWGARIPFRELLGVINETYRSGFQ